MPARIVQVDLAQALAPIATSRRHRQMWILVRFGVQPLGWVRCRRDVIGDVLTPDMIRGLVADFLPQQFLDAARKRLHELPRLENSPPISVIVCTREHPDLLERQLTSMRRLKYPRFEVVVVDNAPKTDRTRRVCEKFDFVRHVLERRPGLDYARNTGWQNARYPIVAYTDDDATVDPNWLSALAVNYADTRVQCVTGLTLPMELETPAQEHFEKYGGFQRGFQRRIYRPGTWNTFYPLGSGRFGAGVNLSLRTSALAAMGGFDVALDVGSLGRGGGDLDIMARLIRDGGSLVYEPRAIVWHQHRRTMPQLRRQMFDYGWGFTAYVMKHSTDLELGNQSIKMIARWGRKWGFKRLWQNLKLALQLRGHFPVHLIMLEVLGGILGLRAYGRSRRKVGSDAIRFREKGYFRAAA